MAELTLKNVCKKFGTAVAVSSVDFEVEDGEFIVLVGPSGCGKSTLLRMIAGLETVGSGEIYIAGALINDVPPKDRDIAMVFQNYALYPHMTVYQNMAFGLKMRGVPKTVIRQRVSEAAGILGMDDLLDRRSKALSGGQQQRVAMRSELIKLHKRLGATMIYVTHDQVEAMSLGERLVVLKDGAVQQIAPPLTSIQCPTNRFVADFIGTPPMNFFPCTIKGKEQTLRLVGKEFSLVCPSRLQSPAGPAILPDQQMVLGIRPEDIREKPHSDGAATEQMVTARVEFLETMGSEVLATCRLGDVEFITRLPPQTKIRATEKAALFFDMNRAHLFHPRTGESLG